MNATKRKQTTSFAARFVATYLPFLQGPWRRALVGLLLLAGLFAAAYHGWQRWGGQIVQQPEYVLLPEHIEITTPPPWIRTDVKAESLRDGNLTELSTLDPQLTVKMARIFNMHTWVEEVTRVSKHHPARVVVELVYRKPVGMVEVVMNGQPGLLPIDVNGILLPPADFSAEQARDYLRISVPDANPAGPVGTPWGDGRVHGAARVAAVFQEHWKKLGLYRVAIDEQRVSATVARAPTYCLATRQGARVVWGEAPRPDNVADVQAALRKVSRLLEHVRSHGPLDSSNPTTEIDLTQDSLSERHVASRPSTAR